MTLICEPTDPTRTWGPQLPQHIYTSCCFRPQELTHTIATGKLPSLHFTGFLYKLVVKCDISVLTKYAIMTFHVLLNTQY